MMRLEPLGAGKISFRVDRLDPVVAAGFYMRESIWDLIRTPLFQSIASSTMLLKEAIRDET